MMSVLMASFHVTIHKYAPTHPAALNVPALMDRSLKTEYAKVGGGNSL